MSIFSEHILKLLNDYKRLLRRYLSNSEREKTIIALGIKRKSLKYDNDVILYNKAHRVLSDIMYWSSKLNRVAGEYSGVDEFYQYLQNYLSNYRVEHSLVVHISQHASRALVQAIQLISLPEIHVSDNNVAKLTNCVQTVAKFGTKDQRRLLANALYKQRVQSSNDSFRHPSLDSFVQHYREANPG